MPHLRTSLRLRSVAHLFGEHGLRLRGFAVHTVLSWWQRRFPKVFHDGKSMYCCQVVVLFGKSFFSEREVFF